MIIGIDLGTTHSVVAHLSSDGPKLIPNALGEVLTPSVIGFDADGRLLAGRAAKDYQVTHPQRCAGLFKRHMGGNDKIDVGGHKLSAIELSCLVLKSLKADAEAHFGQPVHEAVITVPAYFNDLQRKATIAAGKMAGLDVKRILNEPTAAALAYGLHGRGEDQTLIVLDLGGGTFDVSVVEVFDGSIEVKASAGESFLGGEDFTRSLAADLLNELGLVYEQAEVKHPHMVSRLMQQCELAKRTLSRSPTASVRMPDRAGELSHASPPVEITLERFERATKHLLSRLEMPIRRALGDAGVTRAGLDEIILVGGATRMPSLRAYVETLFDRPARCEINPDEVVAVGAAVQAALFASDAVVDDLVVTDVCPFTLGIQITKHVGNEVRDNGFLPIINRNTTIPVTRVDRVGTVAANQKVVNVVVYQGESRTIENNTEIGRFAVRDIPPGPPGQEVDVRFTYDLNGVLEVETTVVATGKKTSKVITAHAAHLNEAQLQKAIEAMQQLKLQPREEAACQALIKRAERIYSEMPPAIRDAFGQLIDGLEGAVRMQDRVAIAAMQQAIQEFLSLHWESEGDEQDDW